MILDILPHRIDPAQWAESYDETRALLVAHPARLLGYVWSEIAGVRLPVYTRAIERDRHAPTARRWCVAGDRALLAVGEPQVMHRDLGRYVASTSTPHADILLAFALDAPAADAEAVYRALPAHPVPSPGCAPRTGHRSGSARPAFGLARVLGVAACSASYALPVLAAAMVVETRFPHAAMVHGEIGREQAEAARRWAEGVLGRPVALPVRVEAFRLMERLGAHFEAKALTDAVERLHLAPPETKDATLLGVFGREADLWWLGKLRRHVRPDGPGALRLLAAYLEATRDLGRLCGLACLDARGPRYTPEALMKALVVLRLDEATVEPALTLAFGGGARRLVEVLRQQAVPNAPAAPTDGSSESVNEEIDRLATLPTPGDLTPPQRDHVRTLVAEALRRAQPGCALGGLRTMATSLALAGPTLTEDAWEWITREHDGPVVAFVTALASLELGAELGEVRRALFENRQLCHYALSAHLP